MSECAEPTTGGSTLFIFPVSLVAVIFMWCTPGETLIYLILCFIASGLFVHYVDPLGLRVD